jgi:hypothetical protein
VPPRSRTLDVYIIEMRESFMSRHVPDFWSMQRTPTLAMRVARSMRAHPDSSLLDRVSSRNVYEATEAKTPSRDRIIAAWVGGE